MVPGHVRLTVSQLHCLEVKLNFEDSPFRAGVVPSAHQNKLDTLRIRATTPPLHLLLNSSGYTTETSLCIWRKEVCHYLLRGADTAEVCSDIVLVVVDGKVECKCAKAATHIVCT